jgi:hypothetical protein
MLFLLLAACQTPLVCLPPDVWITNAEGVEDAYCTITLDACTEGATLSASCSLDAFSEDYDCSWTAVRPPNNVASGIFRSEDICLVDEAEMVDQIAAYTPFSIRLE